MKLSTVMVSSSLSDREKVPVFVAWKDKVFVGNSVLVVVNRSVEE